MKKQKAMGFKIILIATLAWLPMLAGAAVSGDSTGFAARQTGFVETEQEQKQSLKNRLLAKMLSKKLAKQAAKTNRPDPDDPEKKEVPKGGLPALLLAIFGISLMVIGVLIAAKPIFMIMPLAYFVFSMVAGFKTLNNKNSRRGQKIMAGIAIGLTTILMVLILAGGIGG